MLRKIYNVFMTFRRPDEATIEQLKDELNDAYENGRATGAWINHEQLRLTHQTLDEMCGLLQRYRAPEHVPLERDITELIRGMIEGVTIPQEIEAEY